MSRKTSKIITVFSTKGGVGKSTLVSLLSGVISNLEKKVLLVDLDFSSGAISLMLNLEPKKTIYNLVDDLNNRRLKNIDDYILKYNDNIDVISTCLDPRESNKIFPKDIDMVLSMFNKYDYILVDTNHILSDNNIMLLDKSTYVLLNITNDLVDLKNTRNLVAVFDDISKKNYKIILNESINNSAFFTMFDIRNILNKNVDYTLNFKIKNINSHFLNGEVLSLNKKIIRRNKKELKKLKNLILEIDKEVNNE